MLGTYNMNRKGLGQFTPGGRSWTEFLTFTQSRQGSTGRDAIKTSWQDLLEQHRESVARAKALLAKMPVSAPRDALLEEVGYLEGDINNYQYTLNNLESFTDSQLKSTFEVFNDDFSAIKYRIHPDIQAVSGGVTLINPDQFNQIAQEVKESMSPADLQEIRDKAGSDEVYFAQMSNNLYNKALVNAIQEQTDLSPETMKRIGDRIDVQKDFLDESEPSALQKITETAPVGKVLDYYEKEGNPFAKPFDFIPRQWKWIIMGTAGIAGLYYIAKIAGVFGGIRQRRKPRPVMANPYGRGAKYFHIRTYDPKKIQKGRYGTVDIGKTGGAKFVVGRPRGRKTTVVQKVTVPKKDVPEKYHEAVKRMEVRAENVKPYSREHVLKRFKEMGVRI